MIGIYRLVKILNVAGRTFRRRACITGSMTLYTIRRGVRTRQRECSHTVVKNVICAPGRMTSQARCTIIGVAGHAIMAIIRFRIHMTRNTSKFGIISRVGMAFCTSAPFAFMFAAVDGKVLGIMIEGRRGPGILRMAGRAIGGKHKCAVVGIGRLIKIILVTTYTSCRCI